MTKFSEIDFEDRFQKNPKIVDALDLFISNYGLFPVKASDDYMLNEMLRNDKKFALIHPNSAICDLFGSRIPKVEDILEPLNKNSNQTQNLTWNNLYTLNNVSQIKNNVKDQFRDVANIKNKNDDKIETKKKVVDLDSFRERKEIVYFNNNSNNNAFGSFNNSSSQFLPISYRNLPKLYSPNNYTNFQSLEYRLQNNVNNIHNQILPRFNKYQYYIASKNFGVTSYKN